jgi:tRNA modification GTPase
MSLDISCEDTICALSTAHGCGAIAIVRMSGPESLTIFGKIFSKKGEIRPGRAMHGLVIDQHGQQIDDVMALIFEGSRSFTGENSAEIHCHGNPIIIDQILGLLCALGARLAKPGEFSMRALLNGKIDLAQAESIADLIHAQTSAAKDAALQGVKGGLAQKTISVQEMLISVLAEIEARMDFPDEELGGYDKEHLLARLGEGIELLKNLLSSATYGIKLHEGARIVICGLPNAGKSTLLNQLCGEERAIVHNSAGTTRDVIEARIDLDGVPVVMVDVAGIRTVDEKNEVEQIGINKAFQELEKAHAIMWLADATEPLPFQDPTIRERLKNSSVPIIHVLNKADLVPKINENPAITISAKHAQGLNELKARLKKIVIGDAQLPSEIFITRARQRDEISLALEGLVEAHHALKMGLVDEVITSELRAAGLAFDRLFGTDLSENVLDKIFSEFCIGK